MRTVAHLYKPEGIRVNALCPGAVRTPILPPSGWEFMPEDAFTPMGQVVEVVLGLARGEDEVVDSRGVRVAPGDMYGQAVVANGRNVYFHGLPEYYDDVLARSFEATKYQKEGLE